MAGFKDPGFQERTASAAAAKTKALELLRSKPPIDEAEVAARIARREAREAAEAEKRAQARAAREEAAAQKLASKLEAQRAAEEASKKVELTDAERKAARDARYAARKNRKNGR